MNNFIRKVIVFIIVIVEALGISCVTDDYRFKQELLSEINSQREIIGLNDLKLSTDLSDAAEIRAKEAAEQWSHIRPDGTQYDALINDSDWSISGENLAKCSDGVSSKFIVQAWMKSELHRINIINPKFTQCGIGIYKQNNTVYIALIFTD